MKAFKIFLSSSLFVTTKHMEKSGMLTFDVFVAYVNKEGQLL